MGKKINLSHNLMGCRLDNWIRLKRSNPITEENEGQVRLITAVSSILAIPAFLEWLVFYVPIKRTKIKKRSGIYRWLLAFRNDIFTESADQGSTVWMV